MKPMLKPMPVDIKKIYADADSGADAGSNIFDSDSDKNAIGLASLG